MGWGGGWWWGGGGQGGQLGALERAHLARFTNTECIACCARLRTRQPALRHQVQRNRLPAALTSLLFPTCPGADEGGQGARGVRVMTMHAAKGLEFEAVFVPGAPAWGTTALPGLERREAALRPGDRPGACPQHAGLIFDPCGSTCIAAVRPQVACTAILTAAPGHSHRFVSQAATK